MPKEVSLLDRVVELIDHQFARTGDWDGPAHLVRVEADPRRDPDGITIAYKEIDGHPLDHLLGFTAPDEWTVLGVVVHGWARSIDDRDGRDRRRIRQVFLVGRSGATASIVRFRDAPDDAPFTEPPGEGRLLDALLRCFDLPTAAPTTSTAELFTAWWLDDVAAAAERRHPKRLGWAEVERLHPAVKLLRDGGTRRAGADDVCVLEAARAMGNAIDWPHLRTLATLDKLPGRVDAHLAAWMDDGMFSRWLLAQQAPVDVLLDEVADHLTPSAARRLGNTVVLVRQPHRAASVGSS